MREMEKRHGPYNAIISSFVVNPCMPPGIFDRAVDRFFEVAMDSEMYHGLPVLEPMCYPVECWKEEAEDGLAYPVGSLMANSSKVKGRWKSTFGWNVTRSDYDEWAWMLTQAGWVLPWVDVFRKYSGTHVFEVPVWTDVHIDTEDEWDLAEWYFGKYIGEGEVGYNAYRDYRNTWIGGIHG
jgi:hypothetical protein